MSKKKKSKVDPKDLWSLDATIAEFALPRLKAFRKCKKGHPCNFSSEKEWNYVIGEMIWLMKRSIKCDHPYDPEGMVRYNRACKYWGEYFNALWC